MVIQYADHSERSRGKSQTEAEKHRKRESTLLKFQTVSAEQILWILNCSLPRKITTANLNCVSLRTMRRAKSQMLKLKQVTTAKKDDSDD